MLQRINSISGILLCILFFSGCSTAKIPAGYRFNPTDLKREISGNWIEIYNNSDPVLVSEKKISGELIAIQSDTVYILTIQKLRSVPLINISQATLYIYINQGAKYAITTGLLFLPDIVAAIAYSSGYFLLLGVPWVVTGSIISYLEGENHSNLLIYPFKNQLKDFIKFARFPQGMPDGLVKDRLRLVVNK